MQREKNHLQITIEILLILIFLLAGCSQTVDPCLGTEPHAIGVNIAANYNVDYAQVMEWYCDGSGFDDIILALETKSTSPDTSVEELLQLIADGQSWDEIWDEIGLMD